MHQKLNFNFNFNFNFCQFIITLSLSFFSSSLVMGEGAAREIPPLSAPVVDEGNVLSDQDKNFLNQSLVKYKNLYGPQIQVLTVNSLEGDSLEDFSIRVADQWKLGSKDQDNGVLFLVALQERKMRIEVGQGLEGDLPDITAGRIIRDVGKFFKQKQYSQGIFFGVRTIALQLGHDLPDLSADQQKNLVSPPKKRKTTTFFELLIFIFIIIFFFLGRNTSSYRYGRPGGRSGGWSTGGGSFRSGGGSSWGGGGGGFSGGGASGDW